MKIVIFIIFNFLLIILPILLAVAFLTLIERKLLASVQLRRGPFFIGIFGLMQPLADGLKLFLKESVIPSQANNLLFIIAPLVTFSVSLMGWSIIPFSFKANFSDIDLGILYFLSISSIAVYGIILAGWSSNSKYAFLGSLRSAAQMISYEVSMGLILLNILVYSDSLNFKEIILSQEFLWFIFPFFPIFILFFVSSLAETNRPPFDLPEAEAELVAGYIVEYASITFAFFFIGEYANIIFSSFLSICLFFGGWFSFYNFDNFFIINVFYLLKLIIILFLFIMVRATLPRYRYDQLMQLGWKFILPLALGFLVFYIGIFFFFYYS